MLSIASYPESEFEERRSPANFQSVLEDKRQKTRCPNLLHYLNTQSDVDCT